MVRSYMALGLATGLALAGGVTWILARSLGPFVASRGGGDLDRAFPGPRERATLTRVALDGRVGPTTDLAALGIGEPEAAPPRVVALADGGVALVVGTARGVAIARVAADGRPQEVWRLERQAGDPIPLVSSVGAAVDGDTLWLAGAASDLVDPATPDYHGPIVIALALATGEVRGAFHLERGAPGGAVCNSPARAAGPGAPRSL